MHRPHHVQRSYVLLAISLAMILVGCGMLLFVAQHTEDDSAIVVAGATTDVPTQCIPEPQPAAMPDLVTGLLTPQHITIEKLGVDATIVPVTAVDGVLQIPEDVNEIGWYESSAVPEAFEGSAVLVGHRDGKLGIDGAFYNLSTLRPGDLVEVTNQRGITSQYVVVSRDIVPKSQFSAKSTDYISLEGSPRLTMITCGGYYDKDAGGYQANVIVTARRVIHSEPDGDDDSTPLTDTDQDSVGRTATSE